MQTRLRKFVPVTCSRRQIISSGSGSADADSDDDSDDDEAAAAVDSGPAGDVSDEAQADKQKTANTMK